MNLETNNCLVQVRRDLN